MKENRKGLIFLAKYDILRKDGQKGRFIMAKVTKDTIIMDVLKMDPGTAEFFFAIGMHCLGCPSASGESVEQACMVHGVDADELIEKINAYLESK